VSSYTSGPRAGRRIHGLDAAEREEQRRTQLLESALDLFARNGYANTSVEQVCQRASVSTKSFYRIFENREDLYIAVYNKFSEDAFEQMYALLEAVPDDEEVATEQMLNALVRAYFEDPRRGVVIQGMARAITPRIERLRLENRRRAAAFLEGLWKHFGIDGDTAGVAVAVMGGIFDLFTSWLVDADPSDAEQLDELAADVKRFYRAVRAGLPSVLE
jgi:AcrR family transcriptional regulator